MGSRTERFKVCNSIKEQQEREIKFKGHNMPYVAIGTLILWFGWYGFNAGSALGITGSNENLTAVVSMNTSIAAAMSGLTAFTIELIATKFKIHDPLMLLNGILSGLVAITAGCNVVEPYVALIIGIVAGFVYYFSSILLKKLKIDDVIDAVPVHGFCGILGVVVVGLFDKQKGLFYSGKGYLLGIQIIGVIVIFAWTAINSAITFIILSKTGLLRISKEDEIRGMDIVEHGG